MGGEREMTMPSKVKNQVIGNLRVHESNGEVHFHDDARGMKAAVPVDRMFRAWQQLSSGQTRKFKYQDPNNMTELRLRVISKKGKPLDLQARIRKIQVLTNIAQSNDYKAFDAFIIGAQ